MKKLFLVLTGSLCVFLAACTNEEAVSTSENAIDLTSAQARPTGNTTIDGLYSTMINSASYIAAENARAAFMSKINFDGDIKDLETNESLLTWIGNNLSKTSFTSATAAKDAQANVIQQETLAFNQNITLFVEIGKLTRPVDAWTLLIDDPQYAATGDKCGCDVAMDKALAAAATIYRQKMSFIDYTANDGGAKAGKDIAAARNAYDASCKKARTDYDLCVYNCANSGH
jgi:hypothetical protein